MRDEKTLEVSNVGGWSLDGTAGVKAWAAGYVGSVGRGNEDGLEAEIDLEQPGSAEVVAHLRRWGTLPDPLPAGVTITEKRDVDVETWGHESQRGFDTTRTTGRTETGTLMRDGVEGDYAKGTHTESDSRYAVFGELPVSSETHELEVFAPEDGPTEMRTESAYTGQGMKAAVQDDLAAGDIERARKLYGDEAGTYTVETVYAQDEVDGGLEDLSRRAAQDKYGDLFEEFAKKQGGKVVQGADLITDEHDQMRQYLELVEGLTAEEIDLGAVAEYVASRGGEAVEFLRYNTQQETTHVGSPDSDALQGRAGYDAIELQITAMKLAGEVDPREQERLTTHLLRRIAAVEASDAPAGVKHVELKHLRDQLLRVQR
jgi:hypothetical protein